MNLWEQKPIGEEVAYGSIGFNGYLGFSSLDVCIKGVNYDHTISCHGPSRVFYASPDYDALLVVHAAINDTAQGSVAADFNIYVNGTLASSAGMIKPMVGLKRMTAYVPANSTITLEVSTPKMDFCHSVWVDPVITPIPLTWQSPGAYFECPVNAKPPKYDLTVCCVASGNFTDWLEECLQSFHQHARLPDAHFLVFALNPTPKTLYVCQKHQAQVVIVKQNAESSFGLYKNIALAAPYVVDSKNYLYLDIDTLVLDRLDSLTNGIDLLENRSLFVGRESDTGLGETLKDISPKAYKLDHPAVPLATPINSGVYAGSKKAFLQLENAWQNQEHHIMEWLRTSFQVGWREQYVFNTIVHDLKCGVMMHPKYNHQLLYMPIDKHEADDKSLRVFAKDYECAILHFNGDSREKYKFLRGTYLDKVARLALPADMPLDLSLADACNIMESKYGRAWKKKALLTTHKSPISNISETFKETAIELIKYKAFQVIDLDALAGVASATFAEHGINVKCVHNEENRFREELFNMLHDGVRSFVNEIHADPLVYLRSISSRCSVYISTCHSEKTLFLAASSLKTNDFIERVIIQNMHCSLSSFDGVKQRLSEQNLRTKLHLMSSPNPIMVVER